MTNVAEVIEKLILEKIQAIREISERIERAEDQGVTSATNIEMRRVMQSEVEVLQKFLSNWKGRK